VALDGDPALTLPASGLLPVTITTPPVITRTLLAMARITGTLAGRTAPRGAGMPGVETSQMRPASAGPARGHDFRVLGDAGLDLEGLPESINAEAVGRDEILEVRIKVENEGQRAYSRSLKRWSPGAL
jgi:hypothetical protein